MGFRPSQLELVDSILFYSSGCVTIVVQTNLQMMSPFFWCPQSVCSGGICLGHSLPPAFPEGCLSFQEVLASSAHWDQDRAADSYPHGLRSPATSQEPGGDH